MENWCWSEDGLAMIAVHHETGEKMPVELIAKMLKAKNFQSSMQLLRQVEFSLFDLDIHQKTINEPRDIQKSLDNIRKNIAVLIPPKNNRFQHGFSHIFAGGYSAGYYSYKWAEVLSADVFAAFEEEGLFNKAVGQRYKHCILEKGGSRPAIESFECFRGRKPTIEALLRHNSIQ
jgi:oligopeptidase A